MSDRQLGSSIANTPSAYLHPHSRVEPPPVLTATYSVVNPPPATRPVDEWSTYQTCVSHSANRRALHPSSDAVESWSRSSVASYSHPASLRNDPTESQPYTHASSAERGHMEAEFDEKGMSEVVPRDAYPALSSTPGGTLQNSMQVISYIHNDDPQEPKDHAIWVLIYLSFLIPLFSFIAALYTLITTLILLAGTPFHLCWPTCSIREQIVRWVSPLLRTHLRLIYSPSIRDGIPREYKTWMLVFVLLGSPFASLGVSVAAWVAACFWIFATMMGNPDGTEKKDDGRAAVLGVRGWCDRWFCRAVYDDVNL